MPTTQTPEVSGKAMQQGSPQYGLPFLIVREQRDAPAVPLGASKVTQHRENECERSMSLAFEYGTRNAQNGIESD
jgi:hypothetical protein